MTKVHQVPVSAVLALMKASNTAHFLCYNVAVVMLPIFEREYYEQWAAYKENNFDNEDVGSGYYAFWFIKFNLQSAKFETSMFKDNLTNWVQQYFGTLEVDTIGLNCLAAELNMDRRKFRVLLLEKVLADNPDAMFHVKI